MDAVQRMLTGVPTPTGLMELYKALYNAGDVGLSITEIATAMNWTRAQMAGVFGALGVRVIY